MRVPRLVILVKLIIPLHYFKLNGTYVFLDDNLIMQIIPCALFLKKLEDQKTHMLCSHFSFYLAKRFTLKDVSMEKQMGSKC